MKRSYLALIVCLLASLDLPMRAQRDEGAGALMTPQLRSDKLGAPEHMRSYVVEGKLRLSLRDAVVLTLENNSFVRVQETQVESSKFTLLGAHSPFDPSLTSSYNVTSTTSLPITQLQGTGSNAILKSTTQFAQFNYSQTFETGTNVQAGMTSNNNFANNSFFLFNPQITSALIFQVTQPLLRNGWRFANQAPLVIARRNVQQSRANFAAEVNDNILQAVAQYWSVVESRGNLDVARSSMEAAEATYKRDKRALELGALPPLDIYRSESQVASRRVQVIQSEYALKQAEDALRLTIGADQDPYLQALDLELTEKAEPEGELRSTDATTALQQALAKRPEFDASRAALANDATRVRLAHNHLLPELDLLGYYASNGAGGTQFPNGQRVTTSSISQVFGFSYPTYQAQLSLTLPVRNRAAKAEMGNALVSRRSDLYIQRRLQEQVTLDVSNAVHQLEQAKLSIVAGKEALDLAKKTMAAEQRKYELGSGTIFLVLEAQTEVAAAEQSLLQAEVGYQLAVAAVDHATGELLEPYHVQIAELTKWHESWQALFVFHFSRRANETARFSSEVRSASPVATWTGLPDSLPIQSFNSCAVVLTNRPCRRTGIPSDAHLCTTEVGSPRKAAICRQPLSSSDCVLALAFDDLDLFVITVSANFLDASGRHKVNARACSLTLQWVHCLRSSVRKWRNWQTHQT